MGADIEGDGRLEGDRSDPPVVDVCLPPDGQFHQPHDTAPSVLPDLVEALMTEMRLRSKFLLGIQPSAGPLNHLGLSPNASRVPGFAGRVHRGRSVLLPLHVADDADRTARRSEGGLDGGPGVLLHAGGFVDHSTIDVFAVQAKIARSCLGYSRARVHATFWV